MKMVRITNTFNNRLAAKNIFAIYKNELNIKWILEKNDENKQVPVCGFKNQTNEISKKKKIFIIILLKVISCWQKAYG